jgi:hypothetical protein
MTWKSDKLRIIVKADTMAMVVDKKGCCLNRVGIIPRLSQINSRRRRASILAERCGRTDEVADLRDETAPCTH